MISSIQDSHSTEWTTAPVQSETEISHSYFNPEPDIAWQELMAKAYDCIVGLDASKDLLRALEYANALVALNCDYSGEKWVYEPMVFGLRSFIYHQLGKLNDAASDHLTMTEMLMAHEGEIPDLDACLPSIVLQRGVSLFYLGRTEEAIELFQKRGDHLAALLLKTKGIALEPRAVIQWEPSDPTDKAKLLFAQGLYREVIELSAATLEKDPSCDELHILRGDSYLLLGETDLAIEDYKKGLEFDNTSDLHLALAIAYSISGDRELILSELDQVGGPTEDFQLTVELLKQIL